MAVTVHWKLQHTDTGAVIEINDPVFKIGRHPASQISTKNEWISRNHALLTILVGEALYVQDLGSSNGTFLNHVQIASNEPVPLKHGDVLNFGSHKNYTYTILKEYRLPPPVQVVEEPHTSSEIPAENKENPLTSIKNEEPTVGNSSHFSSCFDDCIVISDDDDDDPFAMSQIIQITEKVKNESRLDDYDPYVEIKNELADLDFCETFGDPMNDIIDLDPFENTKELLDLLESSSKERENNTEVSNNKKANSSVKIISISDGEIEIRKRDQRDEPGPNSSKELKAQNELERRKSAESGKRKDVDVGRRRSTRRKSTDNEFGTYISKSKFGIPPAVEAHTLCNFDKCIKLRSKANKNKDLQIEKAQPKETDNTSKDAVKRMSISNDTSVVEKVKTGNRTSTPIKGKGSDQPTNESSAKERKNDIEVRDNEKTSSFVKTLDVSDGEIEIRKKDPKHEPRHSSPKDLKVVLESTSPHTENKSERRKSADSGKKKDEDVGRRRSTRRKSTDKNESSAYVSKSKFKVPPVVEAHSINYEKCKTLRYSGNKYLDLHKGKEKPKESEKLFSPLLVSKYAVKRRSGSINAPIIEKKLKTENKSAMESMKEIRKQKLKELGKTQTENKQVVKAKVVTQVPKVKDPWRGAFLLDKPPPKASADRQNKPIERPVDSRRITPAASTILGSNDSEIQDRTITSQLSPTDQITRKTGTTNGTSKPSRSILDCVTMSEFMNKTQACPDSTIKTRRNRWAQNNMYRELDRVDEYISQIVFWNVRWILEQKEQEISPPINKHNEEMVPLEFSSFEKYVYVMQPLIMLELWNYIYSSCTNTNRQPFLATLVHVRYTADLSYLDCICYLPEESCTTLKPDDIILIECKLIDNLNVSYQFTGFGCIKYCSRIDNKREGHSKSANVKFTLVTRSFDRRVSGKQVLIKMADNIANFLRLFKTMKYVKFSPLIGNILRPCIKDYRVLVEKEDMNVTENKLNESQREAVLEARHVCLGNEPKIYLLKGPPGTGKSTVITSLILELVLNSENEDSNPLILLTAPSNAAVDSLIGKLALARQKIRDEKKRRKVKIVRVGPESSINGNVEKFKLSTLVRNNMITEYRLNECTEYQKYADEGRLDEFVRKKLANKYHYEQKRLEDVVLKRSNVICSTLQSCTHNKILQTWRSGGLRNFTCCIIDEATQCTELESLLPIQLGIIKFIMVGDPKQLPAVVTNRDASKLGLGMSLFARIEEKFRHNPRSPVRLLEIQYRMAPAICEYPNQAFYNGRISSMPKCDNPIQPTLRPYILFNLIRTLYDDESEFTNIKEVHFICKLLETLKTHVKKQCFYSVGVIAPYRAQIDLLRQQISNIKFPQEATVTVNTVDSFQGAECDVIIISCVRLNSNCFLQNEQRLNVALTRAKQALYVVGNYSLFKHCKPLYDLRENAKLRRLCFDIKETPKDLPLLHKFIFT